MEEVYEATGLQTKSIATPVNSQNYLVYSIEKNKMQVQVSRLRPIRERDHFSIMLSVGVSRMG
jgi:hypothetical protein